MKRISLWLIITSATFFIGISIVAIWFYYRSATVVDVAPTTHDCYPIYVENSFDVSFYKGITTRRVYAINASKTTQPVLEEANAEATAYLFMLFREAPLTSEAPTNHETPLASSVACVDESYRLTWIPTFHAPTVIRVWRSDDKYYIVIKRLNGKGGYGLGNLEIEQTHSLTEAEWKSFEALIYQTSYWNLPPTIEELTPQDGASWAFEGFSGGKFHSVYRIMPSKELSQIFKKLFDLASVETEYKLYLP